MKWPETIGSLGFFLLFGWMVYAFIGVHERSKIPNQTETPKAVPQSQPTPLPMPVVKRDRLAEMFPAARVAVDLIRLHESLDGMLMVGDGGEARGWLGQHEDNWNEGCKQIGKNWKWPENTDDLRKCEWVAVGYWMRHAKKYLEAGNTEELIRRHRLPYAPYRADNNEYLKLVLLRRKK